MIDATSCDDARRIILREYDGMPLFSPAARRSCTADARHAAQHMRTRSRQRMEHATLSRNQSCNGRLFPSGDRGWSL